MHFGGLEDDREDSAALRITFRPQIGGHRQCGLAICTFHLGFSLVQERVGNFLHGLSSRKDEVKRRCRTVLQSRAEGLLRDSQPHSQPTPNAHPTLALVQGKQTGCSGRAWPHVVRYHTPCEDGNGRIVRAVAAWPCPASVLTARSYRPPLPPFLESFLTIRFGLDNATWRSVINPAPPCRMV